MSKLKFSVSRSYVILFYSSFLYILQTILNRRKMRILINQIILLRNRGIKNSYFAPRLLKLISMSSITLNYSRRCVCCTPVGCYNFKYASPENIFTYGVRIFFYHYIITCIWFEINLIIYINKFSLKFRNIYNAFNKCRAGRFFFKECLC